MDFKNFSLIVIQYLHFFYKTAQSTPIINKGIIYEYPGVEIPDVCSKEIETNPMLHPENLPNFKNIKSSHIKKGLECATKFYKVNFDRADDLSEAEKHPEHNIFTFLKVIEAPLEYIRNIKIILLDVNFNEEFRQFDEIKGSTDDAKSEKQEMLNPGHSGQAKTQSFLQRKNNLAARYRKNIVESRTHLNLLVDSTLLDQSQFDDEFLRRTSSNAKNIGHGSEKDQGPWLLKYNDLHLARYLTKNERFLEKIDRELSKVGRIGEYNNMLVVEDVRKLYNAYAKQFGFQSFLDYKKGECMAKDYSTVGSLLVDIEEKLSSKLQNEKSISSPKILAKEINKYFKDYFPHDHVVDVLFTLIKSLFKISIEEYKSDYQTYAEGVKLYEVYNHLNKKSGLVYIDFFKRPGLKVIESAYTKTLRFAINDLDIVPIVFITLNVQSKDRFTIFEIEDFFHEMGHCLQHIFTAKRKLKESGDTFEFPSKFMEHFAKQKNIISKLSTPNLQKQISSEKYDKYRTLIMKAKVFELIQKSQKYLIDLNLFQRLKEPCEDIIKNVQEKYKFRVQKYDQICCSDIHISFHYAGTMYVYIWSEIMAIEAYNHLYKDKDSLRIEQRASQFRELVFEMKGVSTLAKSFQKFVGKENINVKALYDFYQI